MKNIYFSIFILIFISFVLTIISFIIETKYPFVKNINGDTLCANYKILFIRFIHYITFFYFCFYYLFFDKRYDLIFLITYFLIIYKWIITDKCIFTDLENEEYEKLSNGEIIFITKKETKNKHPHYIIFFRNYADYAVLIQCFLMIICLFIVLNRFECNIKKYILFTSSSSIPISNSFILNYYIFACFSLIQIYLLIKDRMYIFGVVDENETTKDNCKLETFISMNQPRKNI